WFKSWNIDVASEKKLRETMKADLEELQVKAAAVPFSFSTKMKQEIKPAPLAYITNLKSAIFCLLEEKASHNQLSWHNGLIPPNEIWMKQGRDK
uniref:Uncharacterized protein n=1 Tax=Amphimedon queenslandica TaxID=400682 RepID=A0A1X7VSJ7_AMPQE